MRNDKEQDGDRRQEEGDGGARSALVFQQFPVTLKAATHTRQNSSQTRHYFTSIKVYHVAFRKHLETTNIDQTK